MANVGSIGTIEYLETFVTKTIAASASSSVASGEAWLVSSDGGDTAFAVAVATGKGMHAAGALSALDDQMIELSGGNLMFSGQEGHSSVEVLFQTDNMADLAFNIGFNDDALEDGGTLPIELSGTSWTTGATSALMLVYDVDATNDEMHCMWVDDGNDAVDAIGTLRMEGAAPVASKWAMARVEMQDRGSGNGVRATLAFYQDGKTFVKEYNTTVDRDVPLCAYTGFENRSTTAHNVYVKYIKLTQSIAD